MSVPVQPVGYYHYFSLNRINIPSNIGHLFYVSWEDALWDLLSHLQYTKPTTALLPEFFCGDVVSSMICHGLKPVYYPVDKNFYTNPQVFAKYLDKHKPSVVVILHSVGITNQLFAQKKVWLPSLSPETLLIEDSVHRIVDPQKIDLISPRHVVIDSLRKVVPVPGSNLYGHKEFINFKSPIWQQAFNYQLKVFWFWLLFQLFLKTGVLWPSISIKNYLYSKAEKTMIIGYDKIGKSYTPASGWSLWGIMSKHLDLAKIYKTKKIQVNIYKQKLKHLLKNSNFFEINIPESDYGFLRGFPLGINVRNSSTILHKIRNNGLLLRFELNDSIWSTKHKVVYLPIGPHLTNKDIYTVCGILAKSCGSK